MKLNDPYDAIKLLLQNKVRLLLIGVFAVNHYARDSSAAYMTQDCDILLQPDPKNLRKAVDAFYKGKYALQCGGEPLIKPDSLTLRRIIEHRALIRAAKPRRMTIDLVLEAKGFSFEQWHRRRKTFTRRMPLGTTTVPQPGTARARSATRSESPSR